MIDEIREFSRALRADIGYYCIMGLIVVMIVLFFWG